MIFLPLLSCYPLTSGRRLRFANLWLAGVFNVAGAIIFRRFLASSLLCVN